MRIILLISSRPEPIKRTSNEKHISKRECEQILFNEFRALPGVFSFYGQYKGLIVEMFNMRVKLIGITAFAFIIVAIIAFFRPVDIVAVHSESDASVILVKNFPYIDKGKINWWLENKSNITSQYHLPLSSPGNFYRVSFLDFGDGYKKLGKEDRICFDDMKTDVNCVDKNVIFSVDKNVDGQFFFHTYNGQYRLTAKGEVQEYKDNFYVK
ncbi:uncharacterized protein DUF3289 [Mangrovibacter plantisponsor]|uniref:Uncharacterized protein DUF3289 n=1 Tax=Mangrovibacter plantisponsor TaxID=451513 RepID=A0A317PZD7_9ENTR|nr:uncharacterized protein DUF3289 [Mangrovibacter plantisponsor]